MLGLKLHLQYTNNSGGLAELHKMLLFVVIALRAKLEQLAQNGNAKCLPSQ